MASLTELKHIHAQFLDDAFTHCLSAAYSMIYIFTPLPFFFLTLKKNMSFFLESTEFLISLLSEMNAAKFISKCALKKTPDSDVTVGYKECRAVV